MKRVTLISRSITILFLFFSFSLSAAVNSHCESQTSSDEIDSKTPRISWEITSGGRNEIQHTYQILVASSIEKLKNNEGDLWDSGDIESHDSIRFAYEGKALTSGMRYFWKVQIKNNKDESVDSSMISDNQVMLSGDLLVWNNDNRVGTKNNNSAVAWNQIEMKPLFPEQFNFVNVTFQSPFGKIESHRHRENGVFNWEIAVPANSSAKVYIPVADVKMIKESGKRISSVKGVKVIGIENGNTVLEIASGKYKFKWEYLDIRIAKYKDDKLAAISYTFDDGLKEHYTLVTPWLNEFGFKGTFWINGSRINENDENIKDTTRMTWGNLIEMAQQGHEISNHGWAHKNFSKFSLDEIREDIFKNDSAIFANVGIMPRTFCYPNNNKKAEGMAIAVQNRVGTRTKQRSIGKKSTHKDLEKWVADLIEKRGWGVGMTHGITYGYDHFSRSELFWEHLQNVKQQEGILWIATFREVAAYEKERDATTFTTRKTKRGWEITPQLNLDSTIFTEWLTALIHLPRAEKIIIKQNGEILKQTMLDNTLRFDFNPFGGKIEVIIP